MSDKFEIIDVTLKWFEKSFVFPFQGKRSLLRAKAQGVALSYGVLPLQVNLI